MEELSAVMFLFSLFCLTLAVIFALYGVPIASFFLGGAIGSAIMALVFACFDD